MRAAVLEEFGAPLVVQEVDLAEPKAGEVLVRLVACGVCHTDMYTASGADPSGYAPAVLGPRGRGRGREARRGRQDLKVGDHVVTLFSPQCRECVHCLSPADEPLHGDPRRAEPRPPARRHDPLSRDGEPIRHFMGTATFTEYTVMPEIALAKVPEEAPLDRCALFACGLSTGLGAAMFTAKVEPGSTCVVFGAGMVGLGAVAGCAAPGAERIICVDLSEDRLELAKGQGATDTLDRRRGHGPARARRDRRLRRRLHVRGHRDRVGDAPGRRVRPHGLGPVHGRGRRRQGRDARHRPALPDHGRRVCGSSFGGVKGRDQVPQLVQRYLDGDIDVDPFISHRITLDEVNHGFELMHAQDGIRSVIEF